MLFYFCVQLLEGPSCELVLFFFFFKVNACLNVAATFEILLYESITFKV